MCIAARLLLRLLLRQLGCMQFPPTMSPFEIPPYFSVLRSRLSAMSSAMNPAFVLHLAPLFRQTAYIDCSMNFVVSRCALTAGP